MRRQWTSAIMMGVLASLVVASTADGQRRRRRVGVATNWRNIDIVVADTGTIIPETTTEGLQTFRLHERVERDHRGRHGVLVQRIPTGMSEAEVLHAVSAGRLAALGLTSLGGPGVPDTSGNAAVQIDLRPGRYLVAVETVDERGRRRIASRNARVLRAVRVSQVSVAVPTPSHARVRLRDDAIEVTRTLTAGQAVLQVEVVGPHDHALSIRRLDPGTTRAEAVRWLETRTGPAPLAYIGGASRMSRGKYVYAFYLLERGEYLLSCDLADGHRPYELSKVITVR